MSDARVNWYGDRVLVRAREATDDILARAAAQISGQAKVNMRNQPSAGHIGLIDTGFMVNSVYIETTTAGDTYGETDRSGEYRNRAGESVPRRIAPESRLPRGVSALVSIGAEYAVMLELRHKCLYRAAEDVAGRIGAIVQTVKRKW